MKNLSIIICTHNRSDLVRDLVLSFNNQKEITPETEIIVVASACSDNTVDSITAIKDQLQATVIIKEVKDPGLSLARNAGLDSATHDYIAFLDDDIRIFPDWAAGFLDAFQNHDCEIVGGCIKLWWHETNEPDWLHFYHKRLLGFNDHGEEIKPIEFGNIFGGNFAIKRTVYETIGGFSTDFGRIGSERLAGEEAEYFLNAKDAGFKFLYTPKASVEHLVNEERASIEYLTRSAFGVGTSRVLLPNQINNINTDLVLKKLALLLEETNKEITSQNSASDYMFHKTRRFDLLGETIGTLKYLFGDIDLSAKTIAEYPLAINNGVVGNESSPPKPVVPLAPSRPNHAYLISVIIPCFNAEKLIEPCLNSLSKQTLSQNLFEVICIDDCSTDNTVKKIESYKGKIKNLVLLKHDKNKKQGAARNTGMENAQGEYITFVDADDYLSTEGLEVLVSLVGGKDLMVAQHEFIYPDESQKNKLSKRTILKNSGISALNGILGWWPVGMLISRDLINNNEITFRENVYFEDIDFVINVALATRTFGVTNDTVYHYIQHTGSTVNKLDEKKLSDSAKAVLHVFNTSLHHKGAEAYQAWVGASSRWLLYQFVRIDEQNELQTEKLRLVEHYCTELMASRLFLILGDSFKENVIQKVKTLFITHAESNDRSVHLQQSNIYSKLSDLGLYSVASLVLENLEDNADQKSQDHKKHQYVEQQVNSSLQKNDDKTLKQTVRCVTIDYLFIPHNHYHGHNLARVAIELNRQGLKCKLLKMHPPHPDEGAYIEKYKDLYIGPSNIFHEEVLPAGIVVMNDWESNVASKIVDWANSRGIATYAVVEGVNDYHDVDTDRSRQAYQKVKNLFLNGEFDRKYFKKSRQRMEVVGIDRLDTLYERVQNQSVNDKKKRKVTINVNFTYGVLEEFSKDWLEDIAKVCSDVSLDFIISRHPADFTDVGNYTVTTRPLYDELIDNEIFITRFSGAVFEALIAGCKVVYYNPEIEKIDKFNEPIGAYLYADSVTSLKESINSILKGWTPEIDEFLKLHVDSEYNNKSNIHHSLGKTTDLLLNDAENNRGSIRKHKGSKEYYFNKGFNSWRQEWWTWSHYPIISSKTDKQPQQEKELSTAQKNGAKAFGILFKPMILPRQRKKLHENPRMFFRDSKNTFTRFIGVLLKLI